MGYGLEVHNLDGDILVDGERVMPKLYAEIDVTGVEGGVTVPITPTTKPLMVTMYSIEGESGGIGLVREGAQYTAVQIGFLAEQGGKSYKVRVYEL